MIHLKLALDPPFESRDLRLRDTPSGGLEVHASGTLVQSLTPEMLASGATVRLEDGTQLVLHRARAEARLSVARDGRPFHLFLRDDPAIFAAKVLLVVAALRQFVVFGVSGSFPQWPLVQLSIAVLLGVAAAITLRRHWLGPILGFCLLVGPMLPNLPARFEERPLRAIGAAALIAWFGLIQWRALRWLRQERTSEPGVPRVRCEAIQEPDARVAELTGA